MREAAANAPLGPMPLAVVAHGRPFELPKHTEEFSSDALESEAWRMTGRADHIAADFGNL